MKSELKKKVATLLLVSISSIAVAQDDWVPTGVWPFLHEKFRVATVVAGFIRPSKTQVPCNIHIGRQTLYYAKDDTLMEATPGSILRVEFPDATYIPIGLNTFGRIMHEDSIGKIIRVREVDMKKFKESGKDASNLGVFQLEANGMFPGFSIDLLGQYEPRPEEKPLPIIDTYFFIFRGETFQATDKNIMSRIDQSRRREYSAFTRSAEILSTSYVSMQKIWKEFFVNYQPKPKKKK